jgi:hypothetical protein
VEVRNAAGAPVTRTTLPAPTATAEVLVPLDPGVYTIVATSDGGSAEASVTVEAARALRVEVQPRPGGDWIEAEGSIPVPVIRGGTTEVLVGVTGGPGMPASVDIADQPLPLAAPGLRAVRAVRVGPEPMPLVVGDARFTLVPALVDPATLARLVRVGGHVFPAEADGSPDAARPAFQVRLPSPAWDQLVRAIGLGGRRRDDLAPWAFWGVALENTGNEPVDLHVTLEIHDAAGPAASFRPRLRTADGDTGVVAALVRVPAGTRTVATLPLFVDTGVVRAGAYTAALTVTPLGGDTPLYKLEEPLYVRRGDPVASAGFAASLLVFLGGVALVVTRLRRWLEAAATSELMTIALFGSATFLVGTAADLVAMGIGAVLGPLSSILTGLLSDLGRYTLLATLISLLPRPGTLTLAILTGWILRGFTVGAFAPVDLLYTGTSIAFAELFAWAAGLTRGGAWRDEPLGARWARLSIGFAGASVATILAALWMHIILYRLFFADWYIALQVLVPGLLYTTLACRVAAGFAASLRRVEA